MLKLSSSLLSRPSLDAPFNTPAHYMNLTPYVGDWKRSIQRQGGFWDASFSMHTDAGDDLADADPNTLKYLFYNALGWHVQESAGGWEGYISEIYMSTGNSQRVRSYNDLYNRIIARNSDKEIVTSLENEASILRYGLIEKEITITNVTNKTAQQQAQNLLNCISWPHSKPAKRIDPTDEISLEFRVNGYIHTASWRLMSFNLLDKYNKTMDCNEQKAYIDQFCGRIGFDPEILMAISAPHQWIIEYILDNYCDYLRPGVVKHNGLYERGQLKGAPLKIMLDLAEKGGAFVEGDYRPFWRLYCDANREVHFDYIDASQPRYYLDDQGDFYDTNWNPVSDWLVRPAVMEDTAFPMAASLPGCVFPRETMFYSDKVDLGADNDWESDVSWNTVDLEESYLDSTHQIGVR